MKKFLLSLLILCAGLLCFFNLKTAYADVAVNSANFPDANFRAYILEKLDGNGDEILSDAEINSVTSMDIRAEGIRTLEGIKIFANLEALQCASNGLTELDLSGLSSIKEVHCRNNGLTSLNIRGCSALRYLDCSSNVLTELDLSNYIYLEDLYCQDNSLTSLKVQNCRALIALNCRGNELSELDIRSCAALEWLYCKSNNLSALDVTRNIRLRNLRCSDNNINNLDVSNCTRLLLLHCYSNNLAALDVSNCAGLQELRCSSNKLTELNVTGCAALKYLSCYGNSLLTLDLSSCGALEVLYGNSQQITNVKTESTGDAVYPFQLDLVNDYGILSSQLVNIVSSEIKAYDTANNEINANFDENSGIIKFASNPVKVLYEYDVNIPDDAPAGHYTMAVIISAQPVITTTELDKAYAGKRYSFNLGATGASPLKWEIIGAKLPDNLRLSQFSGLISGTLANGTENTYKIKVRVSNSAGSDEKELTFIVDPADAAPQKPVIKNAPLPRGILGASYETVLSADGTPPISWSLDSGSSLPDGLSLDVSGKISGTPTVKGVKTFSVKAQNSEGSASRSMGISVIEGDSRPVITTTNSTLPRGVVDEYYDAQIEFTGATPVTFKITNGSLPNYLSLSSSGRITGKPEKIGNTRFTVQASNNYGTTAKTFSLVVRAKIDNNNNRRSSGGGGGGCNNALGLGFIAFIFSCYVFKKLR